MMLLKTAASSSRFFVLYQRCEFHHLTSPVEVKKTYARLRDSNKKHIDLHKVFSKAIIQNGVFEGRYRTTDLDSVSQTLLGVGKYGKLNAGTSDIFSLPIEQQMRYVRRDSELAMLLAQYNDCLALRIMKIFARSWESVSSVRSLAIEEIFSAMNVQKIGRAHV